MMREESTNALQAQSKKACCDNRGARRDDCRKLETGVVSLLQPSTDQSRPF
jgi:hypothetical protein